MRSFRSSGAAYASASGLVDRLDSAPLIERCPDLERVKESQAPDLSKRDPAFSLPLAKGAERRLSLPVENLVDAGKHIYEPTLRVRNICSHLIPRA
jgi:hypothetical protein